MKRFVVPFLILAIGAAVPAVAEAQGRGRVADCPQGPEGKACRQAARGQGGGQGGGGGDDYGARSRPPGRGGNSLGDGWDPREAEARDGVRGGRLVPLEQVIRSIARQSPGQLLDAGLENRGGRQVYRVRWQTNDGRRIDYIVDAQSGAIIGRN